MEALKEESFIVVDIGDTITRAVYVEKSQTGLGLRAVAETETTIEKPELDVTVGVSKAAEALGRQVGRKLWDRGGPVEGVRLLCSSSSGGGLYMMVAGVTSMISGESAKRAALGAGALLMDVFTKDDRRASYQMVGSMRMMKPDIFLLAGGTDGGAIVQVLDMADLLRVADVKPRFGSSFKLPVIYAGNVDIRDEVSKTLPETRYATTAVENVRPSIEQENLGPAREAIYDSYMEHVIVHSPGFDKLAKSVYRDIIPTEAAIGNAVYALAMERQANALAVDVGGSSTDVYSVYSGVFNRSLNADIGLTYGIANIMKQVGVQALSRWLPEDLKEREIRNIVANLMVLQPSRFSPKEAMVRAAAAREAMKLGIESHKEIASRLKGVGVQRTVGDIFTQLLESTYLDMMKTKLIVARGEAFTSTTSADAVLMLLDALEPMGVTEILIDKGNLLPQIGMLQALAADSALRMLEENSLKPMGTCIAPRGTIRRGEQALRIRGKRRDGASIDQVVNQGDIGVVALGEGERAEVVVEPSGKLDIGMGRGKGFTGTVLGGMLGIVLDARGRPLKVSDNRDIAKWLDSISKSAVTAEAVKHV